MDDLKKMKIKEAMISIEMLNDYFSYNRDSGVLTWKKRTSNRVKVGDIAGSETKTGYLHVGFMGVDIKVHRIVWAIENGKWPEMYIDHIDGNRLNNKINNLREATSNQNAWNMRRPSHNTSGIKGVGFCKQTGKYTAWIWINNKKMWLGRHNTKDDAYNAYASEAKKLFGDYYCGGERG